MPRYVAFLRAIYGEKMAPLRRTLEEMGFSNVDSFLASGNLIFETPSHDTHALEEQLEEGLHDTLGYEVATFIRSFEEVTEVARYKPFADEELAADGSTLRVGFLKAASGDDARQELLTYTTDNDALHVDGREVYWLCRTTASESRFSGAVIEKTFGTQATLRNIRTVRRIAAKYA